MCGIAGAFAGRSTEQAKNIITRIVASQFARGPDHQIVEPLQGQRSCVVFGHNRLSIIDLSVSANQPMWDITGRYCIVYNGEIYNYLELRTELQSHGLQFITHSDTEVILNAFAHWGVEALDHFIGPFAFAIFDKQTDQLWLCRDRFGVKPVYYVNDNNTFYFASTCTVLAKELRLKPNLEYAARGLKYMVYEDDSDIAPYEKIKALPSGCYLKVTLNGNLQPTSQLERYYNLSERVEKLIDKLTHTNTDDLLNSLSSELERAVTIRLRSDVPLGVSISGGLDSSSVAALVRSQHQNTTGFSYGHPDEKLTEGPLVAACADYIGIPIHYIWPTSSEILEGLFKTLEAQDAPFASLSVVAQYLVYQKVRSAGVKVLLGGQGGDEILMGYRKYQLFWLLQQFQQKKYFSAAKNILQLLPLFLAESNQIGLYWRNRRRYTANAGMTTALQLPATSILTLGKQIDQALWQRQVQDVTQFSLPTLLRYEDRNSLGNSVESRLPFMDHQVVELGLALPEALKLCAGYGKWPLRHIMQGKIPDQIRLARYKRGFDIPLKQLLDAGLGQKIRMVLQDNHGQIKDFLIPRGQIDTLFSDQQFLQRQNAMAEAITLLWLNKVNT